MTPTFTYIASTDFIKDLTFDYVETYSFQRGIQFEENKKQIQIDFENLKAKKDIQNILSIDEEKQLINCSELLSFTQYIVNDKGQFHPSSKKTNTFLNSDPIIGKIKNILLTEINDIPMWLCSPIYRDALVFYNSDNEIITTLNVCLSCQYMETKIFNYVNGDYKTFDLLKRFFIGIGHDVEDPDYFPLDNLNKLKEKYKK